MPVALAASVQYAEWLGSAPPSERRITWASCASSVGFELPVVVLTLVKIGVLNYRLLVVVISAVLGAVRTHANIEDPVSRDLRIACSYRSGRKRSARRRLRGDVVTGT